MKAMIEDLRFFIGSFFFILGVILIVAGLSHAPSQPTPNLNLFTGAAFVVFAIAMLLLAFRGRNQN